MAALIALCTSAVAEAQIDWHAPRAAGRVWEKKIEENNRQARNRTPEQQAQAEAADAAWNAPLSSSDIEGTLIRNRAEYERRLRLGKSFADQWLDRTARMERLRRGETGTAQSTPRTKAATEKSDPCSADALPAADRAQLQQQYSARARQDGVVVADAWAKEQGRLFYQRLAVEGEC